MTTDGDARRTALVVYGTRPEAIKLAPLVQALERSEHVRPVVAVTGQHREMLDQVNQLFDITPRHDLDIIRPRQTLEGVTVRALEGLSPIVRVERPDVVVVQGDTTTCFVAALAAFYEQVPVVHVEAGLRTDNLYNPFPEEMNRRLTTALAALHLAPTQTSRDNLLREGLPESRICVTGNTVIDALLDVVARDLPLSTELDVVRERRTVLVTLHRRESWGEPMARSAQAVARLARAFPGVLFVLPAHLNPVVREVLLPPLRDLPNVLVTEPLSYRDFATVMAASELVITDSGGVQEEAPSLGKPVLVLRETTERPEAVFAGTVKLVGTDEELVVSEATTLLSDRDAYEAMAHRVNPYGDGHAAARCVQAIEHLLGFGDAPDDFTPGA